MPSTLARRLRAISARLGFERDWYLVLIAAGIGLLMGAVATAFILPLRWIEHWAQDADAHTLLWLVPIAPVAGALVTGIVMELLKSEVRGPGVSTVMYAIHRRKGRIQLRVGVRKWIASTLTIGSGGSAGAEGPIVTIGAVIGSNIARLLRTSPQNTATLLGCGAAAGLSAVFNAPIAGVFFVLEILLRDFSLRTFVPIVIASVVGSAWSHGFLGDDPIFPLDPGFFAEGEHFSLLQTPNYLLLGVVCGIVASLFVRGLDLSEAFFSRIRGPAILRPAIGAAILGLLGLGFILVFGTDEKVPPFYGNGYPVIERLLDPAFYADASGEVKPAVRMLALLLSLGVLKALATCLTIGSGGAGGLFAPSLLLGASVGAVMGYLVNLIGWFPAASPATYALVGMAAVVASATHAPLTAILIVYEITRSYELILPLMLAAVISTVVGRLAYRESVYTSKLTRLGVRVGAMSDLTILRRLSVVDVPLTPAVIVGRDDSVQRLLELSEQFAVTDFVVVDDLKHYEGMVTAADLKSALIYREAVPLLQVSELERSDLPTVTSDETLDLVIDKFALHDAQSLAVLDDAGDGSVLGLITRERLMQRYHTALAGD